MILRPYQKDAVESVYDFLRSGSGNPCVCIPTGGGKTPIIATICRDAVERWGGRVVVLAHVKELLEQSVDKLKAIAPGLDVGVYSAGLKSRQTENAVVVAGIQSVYGRACELGPFNLAIIDEAHLIPQSGNGMYRRFLCEAMIVNPKIRVIGMTATPYRTSTGMLCGPDEILSEVCYDIGVVPLIEAEFLCPLVSKGSKKKISTAALHVRGGEYIANEVEELMGRSDVVNAAVSEIIEHAKGRKSVLIFSAGVSHGGQVEKLLRDCGEDVAGIYGDTIPFIRAEILEDFRAGRLKYLVNCQVLTTGFDAPNIDMIAILRPTLSPGLYYQMVGRGLRISDGKENCLVLDFGGNVMRHGPIDRITPPLARSSRGTESAVGEDADATSLGGGVFLVECENCNSIVEYDNGICPDCEATLPDPNPDPHDATADDANPICGKTEYEDIEVKRSSYSVHRKKGADDSHPRTMQVTYEVGFYRFQSEWVCIEHGGWARSKAVEWWRMRCALPCPQDVEEAVIVASSEMFAATKSIRIKTEAGKKYAEIDGYAIGGIPVAEPGADLSEPVCAGPDFGVDEVPF